MNLRSKTSLLFVIIAFLVGVIIGLAVLGWWLWPVEWTGASFDTLSSADQQNFLRAAIQSYAYNPDDSTAIQRYAALGDHKEKILSDIMANPGNLAKPDVEKFANAIKAPLVLTTTTAIATSTPAPAPATSVVSSLLSIVFNRPSWQNICLPVGMLIVVVVVILLVFLSRRNKKSVEIVVQSIEPMEPGDLELFAEISGQGQAADIQVQGAKMDSDAKISSGIPGETELPDWLREVLKENRQDLAETDIEKPSVELSDSDINEITTSKFLTLELKPANSLDTAEFNSARISNGALLLDKLQKSVEPIIQPVKQEPQPKLEKKAFPFQETQEETFAKFSRDIELTPGIDPENARRLRSLGITAPLLLLKKGASPRGRQSIAAGLGIPEMQVLKWVNSVDLLRIKGLTLEDAHMLKAAGVDILVELATRDPDSLLEKLVDSSKIDNPSYGIPGSAQIQNWITQARELPRIVSYS